MRLLGTSFFFCAVTLAAACSSPDVKLGNGDETSTTGGAGGTSGSGGSGGSGASTSLCSGTVVGTGNCTALDSLKNEATDLCSAANLELSDIVYDGDCNPGEAAFAKVTCCGDVPEPPPPPESCLYEVTGDPSMCQDNATLKVQASDICLSKGYQLVDVVYDDTCGPESSYFAKYVCCQGDEPPPATRSLLRHTARRSRGLHRQQGALDASVLPVRREQRGSHEPRALRRMLAGSVALRQGRVLRPDSAPAQPVLRRFRRRPRGVQRQLESRRASRSALRIQGRQAPIVRG